MKQMRRFTTIILLLFSLGVTLACSFGQSPTPPPATPLTPAPITRELVSVIGAESSTADSGKPFEIIVLNQSNLDICHVHITGSTQNAWGPDILTEDEVIRPGMSWISDAVSGSHDVLLRSCDNAVMGTAWELIADTTVSIGGSGLLPLRVVNESTTVICYLMLSSSTPQNQKEDYLGLGETLDDQFPERIFFVEPGTYNLNALDCEDKLAYNEDGVNVYADTVWTIPGNAELNVAPQTGVTVSIENHTHRDICYVYIAPAEQETWGAEWLGADTVIAPGETRNFDALPGTHDVLVADCAEAVVDAAWEISSDVVLQPGATGSLGVQISNETNRDICYIYISPSSAEEWGEDWLTNMETLFADRIRTFFVEPGTYDLTAQDCDGEEIASQFEVVLQEDWAWTIAD